MKISLRCLSLLIAANAVLAVFPAIGADPPKGQTQTNVNIQVLPYAQLQFLTPSLLYLEVPPSKSTVGFSSSVRFKVSGNAEAAVSAAPDAFILIPPSGNDDGGWMGKAVLNGQSIGYKLLLTFPSNVPAGCGCGPVRTAALPLDSATGTDPLSVNLTLSGGVRQGSVDLLASADWTPNGGLPLPGIYVGQITLTLTADNT